MSRAKLEMPEELLPLPEWRVAAHFRFGPGWLSALALVLFVLAYVIYAQILGHALVHDRTAALIPIETSAWAASIGSLMSVLGFWMMMTTPARSLSHLVRLPFADGVDARARLLQVAHDAFAGKKRAQWINGLAGVVAALVFAIVGISQMVPETSSDETWEHVLWFALVLPFQFALIGRGVFFMLLASRVMRTWAEENMVVDPLNPDALRPLAQIALRSVFEWTLLLSVGLIISLGQNVDPLLMGPIYAAGVVLAVISFVAPLKVANAKLMEAKQAALVDSNAAMAAERQIIAQGGPEGADAGQRLAGLAAYHSIVTSAREWPLDLGVVARLLFYLTIPVLGWVGSALAEKLLDSAL